MRSPNIEKDLFKQNERKMNEKMTCCGCYVTNLLQQYQLSRLKGKFSVFVYYLLMSGFVLI